MARTELKRLGRASPHLDADAAAEWKRVVGALPEDLLVEADRGALEIYCGQIGRIRQGELLTAAELAQLRMLMNDLGLSPSSRRRLQILAEKTAADPFDELMNRRKAREVPS